MGLTLLPRTDAAFLLGPHDAYNAGVRRVGGKAMGLARLHAIGARVPPWFVIPADAFAAHLAQVATGDSIQKQFALLGKTDMDELTARKACDDVSRMLRAAVESARVVESLGDALTARLDGIAPGPFAVRSSMTDEDSARYSFAGQFDTFLALSGADEVLDAVVRCWGSAFTARALAYQRHMGIPLTTTGMAVVVQQMVAADVSGVLFTSDPTVATTDVALVSACWGLGEGIVSGACDADTYRWSERRGEITVSIARKTSRIVRRADGRGTGESDVPDDLREVRCLTKTQLTAISREGMRIADALGGPQDIEWSLADGQLFILQARPITTIRAIKPAEGASNAERVVWDNSNIQESYCGVTTPLTFSFARGAYASVYEQTMRALGISHRVIGNHRPLLRNLLGLVGGRIYYDIRNWYRGLLLLPSFGRNKDDMERMMGLDEPVDFIESEHVTPLAKLRRAPRMIATMARLQLCFARLDRDVAHFLRRFELFVSRVDRERVARASLSELLTTLAWLRAELLERWHVPIINDFYVMMSVGRLRRIAERAGQGDDMARLENLLAGIDGLESTEPMRRLMHMAAMARANRSLATAIQQWSGDRTFAAIRQVSPSFALLLDDYLQRYGDRCMGELKLETVSLRENPAFLVRVLQNYIDSPPADEVRTATTEGARRDAAVRALRDSLGIVARWRLLRALKAARAGIRARESTRLARTRMFGLFRDVYLALGTRLHEAGRLDAPRDVFYLTTEEIAALDIADSSSPNLAAIARERVAEFHEYAKVDLPHRIETIGYDWNLADLTAPAPAADPVSPDVLVGHGCSSGIAEGEVCVVRSQSDNLDIGGKILVALRTDPGWAPLFPSVRGLLIERGSMLSHSAVLARELGIPAVVGIPRLLSRVADGEQVRLDGSTGRVERLSAACEPRR